MGTITERLALIIDGHTDGAVSAVQRLSLAEKAAADRAELLQVKIADLNTRIAKSASGLGTGTQRLQLSKMTNEYQALTSNLANVPGFASKAEKALSKVGLGGLVPQGTLGAVGKAGPGLAAGAALFGEFEFLKSGVNDYIHLADQIRAVQYASSGSAIEASKLVAVTNALGVDSQTAALGVFRLGKNIELAPKRFADYNIAIAHSKNGNVDLIATLANVATAYQKTTDPAKRAAIVYEAFGRAGTSMLPILNQSAAKLKEIAHEAGQQGRIFSQADLNSAKEYEITMRELKDAWQGLAITAGRDLIPALAKVADLATSTIDKVNRSHAIDFLIPILGIAHLFGGGGKKKNARATAAAEVQAQQDAAAQAQLAQQAVATLAGGYDVLAGPQNLASAKQTLASAQDALTRAVDTRRSAIDALAKLKGGGGQAGATQIESANQRVIAAEANLRKAEYVGGDARIASAKAGLLSAQSSLNKLRGDGASQADKLANATDKVRLADKALKDQQAKVKAAQQAVNDATGLSVFEILARGRAQVKNQRGLAAANVKLASSGVGTDAIAAIDALEKQTPGTLAKVARHLNAGIVSQLNAQSDALASAQAEFAAAASNPDLFKGAGTTAGQAFVEGFNNALGDGIPGTARQAPQGASRPVTSKLGSALYAGVPGVTINIGTLQTDARTGKQLAADLAKNARLRALGHGGRYARL